MEPAAPFNVLAVSPPFRFPAHFRDDRDDVQFCSSMAVEKGDLVFAYGVGDCVGMTLRIPLGAVLSSTVSTR